MSKSISTQNTSFMRLQLYAWPIFLTLPSLELTCSPLKNGCWKMKFPFGSGPKISPTFSGAMLVLLVFRECNHPKKKRETPTQAPQLAIQRSSILFSRLQPQGYLMVVTLGSGVPRFSRAVDPLTRVYVRYIRGMRSYPVIQGL